MKKEKQPEQQEQPKVKETSAEPKKKDMATAKWCPSCPHTDGRCRTRGWCDNH